MLFSLYRKSRKHIDLLVSTRISIFSWKDVGLENAEPALSNPWSLEHVSPWLVFQVLPLFWSHPFFSSYVFLSKFPWIKTYLEKECSCLSRKKACEMVPFCLDEWVRSEAKWLGNSDLGQGASSKGCRMALYEESLCPHLSLPSVTWLLRTCFPQHLTRQFVKPCTPLTWVQSPASHTHPWTPSRSDPWVQSQEHPLCTFEYDLRTNSTQKPKEQDFISVLFWGIA